MIENVSHFILGMIFGLSVYLFIRITIVSKKLDRLIRDINDTQNWIRKIQIDICDINKQWQFKSERELKIGLVNLLVILMILLERKFND